jgi:16S rRNA U1498 N3-methylase RsmE
MKQSVEADPPPAGGGTMALTQKELRHLKRLRLTSGEKSCVVKGSNNLSGPQPDSKMEAEAEEKRRLTMQTLQLDPGPTQRDLGRAPEHPHKREVGQNRQTGLFPVSDQGK